MLMMSSAARALGYLTIALIGIAVFVASSFYSQRARMKENIRNRLPAEYRDGEFVYFNECNFGGYTFIFKLSDNSARRLRDNVGAGESGSHQPALWGTEGPIGLPCLGGADMPYRERPGRWLMNHVNLSSTRYRQITHNDSEYVIPSLGIIAGGNEQH